MEVDLVNGGAVDGGLRFAQGEEGGVGRVLHDQGQAAAGDEFFDVGQMPVGLVVVAVIVGMGMCMTVVVIVVMRMAVTMAVIVRMGMAVAVIMIMIVIVMMMAWAQHMLMLSFMAVDRRKFWRGGLSMIIVMMAMIMIVCVALVHKKLGGVDAVLEDLLGRDGVAFDTEGFQAFFDGVKVGARIDEGTHGHVAADTAEAVKVAGFHENFPGGRASWVIG